MFQRKQRRFRRRSNGRGHSHHSNNVGRLRTNSFSNGQNRNNFNSRSSLSAEKILEKYTSLAKEAMSSGDKTLSENYLQHADHFTRIIEDKNRNLNKNATTQTTQTSSNANQDSPEKSNIDKEENFKNKD